MADTPIDLGEERHARQPHYAGPVCCRSCGHLWVAVCPTTTNPFFLECSTCGKMDGMMSSSGLDSLDVQAHYEQRIKDDRHRAHIEGDY